jgi:predicted aspartyl protease
MRATLASVVVFVATAAGPALASGPAFASGPPADAVLADLPFLDSDESNRVYVDLAPPDSDRRLEMLLDTGAAFSILSPDAARSLGVSVRRQKDTPYRRKTRLGRDLQFWIDVSSSDTGTRMGWDFRLLGGNFLEEYVVELDFAARRVRFIDPKRWSVPATAGTGEVVLPMSLSDRRPVVSLAVNGVEVPVLVDTGAPGSLMLAGAKAEAAGVAAREVDGLAMEMALGPVQTRLGEAQRVELGALALERVPALVQPRGSYNWAGPGDSLLGYDLLAEFTVRLDYPQRRLWLAPRPDVRRTLFGGDWNAYRAEGVLLLPSRRALVVGMLEPESAAARRGLRVGDRFEGGRDAAAILADLREGREVVVVRDVDGVGVDTVLPAAGAAETPAP